MSQKPTIQEVQQCYDRLMSAGGLIPVETASFTDDFFQATIEQAATFEVIEGARYWKARVSPLLDGLEHGCDSDRCLTDSTDPLDEIPF